MIFHCFYFSCSFKKFVRAPVIEFVAKVIGQTLELQFATVAIVAKKMV